MAADRVLIDAINAALQPYADAERALGQQRYMKSELPYLGVRLPDLRRALRPVLHEHPAADRRTWEDTVWALVTEATYRESWYAAVALLRDRRAAAWLDPEALNLVRRVVEHTRWWDVVDEVAGHVAGAILLHHKGITDPVMRAWAVDEDLWVRRVAILAPLNHGAATDPGLLADVVLANVEGTAYGSEFFIRKAIGWALRQHARTDPAWVQAFVTAHDGELSGLSKREALKHLTPAG